MIPLTGGLVHSTNLFLTVLDTGKPEIKVLAGLVSGEALLAGSQMTVFSLYHHMVEGVKELPGVSFVRTLILFTRAPSS